MSKEALLSEGVQDASVGVLRDVSERFSFDTFIHFKELANLSSSRGIKPDDWGRLLAEWDYEPARFLEANGRGNCVDFAYYTQAALGRVGVRSEVIGKLPDGHYSGMQKRHMRQRHTSLMAYDKDGSPVLFEPGWKIPQPIPLLPIGIETDTGSWKFKSVEIDDQTLVQETQSPAGNTWNRTFDMTPLDLHDDAQLTRRLLRIPRKMEMLTRLGVDVPHLFIGYDPKIDRLTTNIHDLSDDFTPSAISSRTNERISGMFGYDVKEELLACLAIRSSFQGDFWVR